VIVLPDGEALDLTSWALLGYRVIKATNKEMIQLQKIFQYQ
jgi:hypothetical protein